LEGRPRFLKNRVKEMRLNLVGLNKIANGCAVSRHSRSRRVLRRHRERFKLEAEATADIRRDYRNIGTQKIFARMQVHKQKA
jgi:hypothetical protein